MHQTLDLSSDFSSVCRPHTAGGHSHRAPAISEVMRLPEATGEAYSLATTVTLYLRKWRVKNNEFYDLQVSPVRFVCYALRAMLILFRFIVFAFFIPMVVITVF